MPDITPKRFSKAAFIAAWNNPNLRRNDTAKRFGMTRATAQRYACKFGIHGRRTRYATAGKLVGWREARAS